MTLDVAVETVRNEVAGLTALVGDLPASAMRSSLSALAELVDTAQRVQVLATRHFQKLGAFRSDGATSAAAWLRFHTLMSGANAKRTESAARAIDAVPAVGDALAQGHLGVEHAALLSGLCDRVAAGALDASELGPLIDKAGELPLDRFRDEVRAIEVRLDERDGIDPAERRTLREFDGAQGTKGWRGEFEPAGHAVVRNALDDLVMRAWRDRKGADARPTARQLPRLRADALVEMSRRSLRGKSGPSASVQFGRGAPEVIVLIDLATLCAADVHGQHDQSVCRLADGTPIAVETARRIACGAGIIPAVLGGKGEVLDLGRRQRLASAAQHRALLLRAQRCEVWGCDVPAAWTKAHHVNPWRARGPDETHGETNLDDLVLVCERHHHLVHEGGWRVSRIDGVTYTRRADGRWHGPAPPNGEGS